MTLQQLEYFVGIVENKSMNQAAEYLHISQSNLSLSMNKLSDELDTILFIKDGRNLKLTESGSVLYKEAKKILSDVEQAKILVKHTSKRLTSVSVVSDTIDFSTESLIGLQELFPDINVYHYRELDPLKGKTYLDSGEASFLISMRPLSGSAYVSELLFEEPFMIAMAKNNPMCQQDELSMFDMQNQTFVTLHINTSTRYLHEQIFHTLNCYPSSIFEVNDPETSTISLTRKNMFCLLPKAVAHYNNQFGAPYNPISSLYETKAIKEPEVKRSVYLIYRSDHNFTTKEKIYMKLVHQYADFILQNERYPLNSELSAE